MPFVSLIVEFLRARPAAVFWSAALAQGALWVLVPVLFYTSAPGELPEVLAIGHEWQPGSWLGPPLAFWLAEAAFGLFGHRIFGVYLLSQVCVVSAFWAIYTFGRGMVGKHHAAMAVLLMTGIVVLSIPTPEFGPAVLALPLTALALLFYWRAMIEDRRSYWIALAFDLGLLLLTTFWGLLLFALIAAFTLTTRRGRAALTTIDPWAAATVALLIPFPYLAWLLRSGMPSVRLDRNVLFGSFAEVFFQWPLLVAGILGAHVGLIVLVLLASGLGTDRRVQVPEIERTPLPPVAHRFVLFFAAAPMLVGTLAAALVGAPVTAVWIGQLVLMSGLAVIVTAGDSIRLYRQEIVGTAWIAVLLASPVVTILAIFILPWSFAIELTSQQPTDAIARFFTDSFHRRTGKRLELVVGDTHTAALVAMGSADRPSIFSVATPERTPWANEMDVLRKGAIVVWPIRDATGAPPPVLRARFPGLVPEVPQTFDRRMQGLLPSYRIGWAVIRPAAAPVQ